MAAITSTSAVTTSSTAAEKATTDNTTTATQDRFLKLLVAQLNNQDPMNPLDNAQLTSQIAQINTVSGIQQVNDTLKAVAAQMNSLQLLQGSALVGHKVLVEGNRLDISDDKKGQGSFDLAANAGTVKVEVLTAGGQVVGTVNLGELSAGRQDFEWDASTYAGSTADLRFRVVATNGEQAVGTTSLMRDQVVSASSKDGALALRLAKAGDTAYTHLKAVY